MGIVEPRVVFVSAAFQQTIRILVLMDMHEESLAALGRFPSVATKSTLENCALLLDAARFNGVPVAHCRRIGLRCGESERSPSPWLKDFAPRTNEMVFERELLSCYAAENFDRLMCYIQGPHLMLAGLSTSIAFLATALDAYDRGHLLDFIADASVEQGSTGSEQEDSAFQAIDRFASVIGTATALAVMGPVRWSDTRR